MAINTARHLLWASEENRDPNRQLSREWIVTNGLSGYASGTISGAVTRRYHGLLIAALPAPLGRIVMLNHLSEHLLLGSGRYIDLTDEEFFDRRINLPGGHYLKSFHLETGLPVWRYEIEDMVLEKRLWMPNQQNTVYISYQLLKAPHAVRLELRPSVHYRPQEAPVDIASVQDYALTVKNGTYEILACNTEYPPLRMKLYGANAVFSIDARKKSNVYYRMEEARGYPHVGEHWTPGAFVITLEQEQKATLVASTESWNVIGAQTPEEAAAGELERRFQLMEKAHPALQTGIAPELVLAADQFVVTPGGRIDEAARAHAVGSEVKTIIAGYHWFTDWGRDTMISLEGLTLATGRHLEAGYILRTFATYIRDGLIPNMFPEHDKSGLYHTADATLWFFHALYRYVNISGDRGIVKELMPKLIDIVQHHIHGTRFNIGIDKDGLLQQGQEGYQLTWMDAKVEDWVVTPRRGKAVELNALWYNALCILAEWIKDEQGLEEAKWVLELAQKTRKSFNEQFWYAEGRYLYDVVDQKMGKDAACRPNQILAISLDHPVLETAFWQPVLEKVTQELLTPYGLRSLSPHHEDYKIAYIGNLWARDAAYHQGTVWGWLIGPYIDAWLKVHPGDLAGARVFLKDFEQHLQQTGMGTISEIFDGDFPYEPRGCIAQAWSVGEVLRCLLKTSG